MVYITEAHPSDVWQMQSNVKDKVVFASPRSQDERASVAGTCVRKLGIEIPPVLDDSATRPRARTPAGRTASTDRRTGRIAYKSKPGPFGFKSDELAVALKKY